MASRTSDKRLLVPSAKTASARVALALAAAALLLAGCGGGDSSSGEEGTGTGTDAAAVARAQGAKGAKDAGAAAKAGEKGGSQAGSPQSSSGSPGTSSPAARAPGAKHGPRIAAPKGPPEQAPTPDEVANATVADMTLQSPAILAAGGHLGRLAPTYTCDGADSWPAFSWGGVPAGSAELVLFAMNLQPVNDKIFFDWALAGLDPGLEEIQAGTLPKGAIPGTNGFGRAGYSLCPSGAGETYMFALYALPRSLSPHRGFDPLALRKQVLAVSGNVGLLPAVYERG